MSFEPMYKLYYKKPDEWQTILNNRRQSESSIALPIAIHEYNRRYTYPAFFMYHPDVVKSLLSLEVKKTAFRDLVGQVPGIMVSHLMNGFLSNEIKASNDIEGVHSSRREIQDAIRNSDNQSLRFASIIAKYRAIWKSEGEVVFSSSQAIRALYDEIIAQEIAPLDLPDGFIFRKDSVDVVNQVQKVIHRGTMPETRIIEEMDQALQVLNDEQLQLPIRVALFHYYFGYIHPFYDGNGRTNRFISTAYLTREFHPLIALRLSAVIKSHTKLYYEAFKMANAEINGGDLTTFLIAFLKILEMTVDSATELLRKRINQLNTYTEKLQVFFEKKHILDPLLQKIYFLLLQAQLFSMRVGISKTEIMVTCDKSRGTIYSRFKQIPSDYLITIKQGRTESYMLKKSILD